MTESISTAVAKVDDNQRIQSWLVQSTDDFGYVLPQHIGPQHWVRLAGGLLRRNPDLAKAAVRNPASFKSALLDCARLGHEPGTEAYAFTVFGTEIVGIEQYQGAIERMYRAGGVAAVVCEVVREKDIFHWTPGQRPEHDADWFGKRADRGELVGVYAYAELTTGGISKVVVMGAEEVAEHRAVARTKQVWDKWPEPMWRKTAIHELEKWVPTSAEYRAQHIKQSVAVARAEAIEAPQAQELED